MPKNYPVILGVLILSSGAGNQLVNSKNCQLNSFSVRNDFERAAKVANNFLHKSKSGEGKLKKTIIPVAGSRDPFDLLATNANHNKFSNIEKILQENFSIIKLKSMQHVFKVDTLVLYGFSGRVFLKDYIPLVIIKEPVEWQLRHLYSSHILSLMFLGAGNYAEEEELNILKQSLNGLYLNKIIIIKQTSLGAEYENVVGVLNWLHTNGFWQSMIMDGDGNTLALQHLTGELIWNLTLETFLLQTTNWQNLLGFPINCSMVSNPPRVYIQYDSRQNVTLKGFYGTIINLFVQHYNASLKPIVLSNLDYYSEMDCVNYINNNKVDICGDVLPTHNQYEITYPEEIVASYLMVPYGKPLPRFYYFLKPFQLNVWTIVTVSFFYKIITLALFHRLQHGSWNASLHISYAILSVLNLPFQLTHVMKPYRRFLEFLMILVGFVVANWYLSVLSSLLFTRLYFHDIKSLQNLVDHNISIMVDEFELYLLNATNTDAIIMQQLKLVSSDILRQHRRNLDPDYAYYSQYDKVAFYMHQQKFLLRPRMKVLTGIPPINEVVAGIPMNPRWPFQHLLNDFIKRFIDSGLFQHIYTRSMEEGIQSGYLHYFPTEYHYVEPLSIEYFQMPAMLLAVGCFLAFLGFVLELLVFKRN